MVKSSWSKTCLHLINLAIIVIFEYWSVTMVFYSVNIIPEHIKQKNWKRIFLNFWIYFFSIELSFGKQIGYLYFFYKKSYFSLKPRHWRIDSYNKLIYILKAFLWISFKSIEIRNVIYKLTNSNYEHAKRVCGWEFTKLLRQIRSYS